MIQQYWKTAGLVSLIGFLCYINSLEGEFVFDDSRAVLKNADLLPSTPWLNLLFNDFWGTPLRHSGSHCSYRPVCVASFRLNYYFDGFNPWGYHLVNVLLHCSVCVLVVMVSYIIFTENITVSVAGVLFAVHPIHTEAISGIVGRADVGACLFYLTSWLAYHKGCRDYKKYCGTCWPWLCLSMLLAALSMLSKEQGITVLGVCALYDIIVISQIRIQNFTTSIKQANETGFFKRMILLFFTVVSLFGMRMWLMGSEPPSFSQADNPAANSEIFLTRALTFLLLPARNFWLLVFPQTLCFDWSVGSIRLVEDIWDARNVFSLVFYSFLVLLLVYCANGLESADAKKETRQKATPGDTKRLAKHHFGVRNRKVVRKIDKKSNVSPPKTSSAPKTSFAPPGDSVNDKMNQVIKNTLDNYERVTLSLTFLVLPFIPATNLFFYVGFVIAERILYIPSVGFCLLVGHLFSTSWKASGKFLRILLATVTCVYLILMSARTVRRNVDWRNDENLYRSGIAVNPSKAWSNLGNVLKAQGKTADAEHAYTKSIEHKTSADTWYNLGLLYQEQKRYKESAECYQEATALRSRFVLPFLNLAIVRENMGSKENALDILSHATQINGEGLKDPKQHENGVAAAKFHRGRILAELNRVDEAIEVYYDAVRTRPDHFPPHSLFNLLGEALFAKGDREEAELWYKKSLHSKEDHIPAFMALAKLFSKTERVKEAEQLYDEALKLEPRNMDIYIHYSKHLSNHGKDTEAAQAMSKAASISPENYDVVAIAADACRKINDYDHAELYYEQAAGLKPDLASAQMNLGAVYHLVGKYELAEKYYLKTLELSPDDKSTKGNLRKLRVKQERESS